MPDSERMLEPRASPISTVSWSSRVWPSSTAAAPCGSAAASRADAAGVAGRGLRAAGRTTVTPTASTGSRTGPRGRRGHLLGPPRRSPRPSRGRRSPPGAVRRAGARRRRARRPAPWSRRRRNRRRGRAIRRAGRPGRAVRLPGRRAGRGGRPAGPHDAGRDGPWPVPGLRRLLAGAETRAVTGRRPDASTEVELDVRASARPTLRLRCPRTGEPGGSRRSDPV